MLRATSNRLLHTCLCRTSEVLVTCTRGECWNNFRPTDRFCCSQTIGRSANKVHDISRKILLGGPHRAASRSCERTISPAGFCEQDSLPCGICLEKIRLLLGAKQTQKSLEFEHVPGCSVPPRQIQSTSTLPKAKQ